MYPSSRSVRLSCGAAFIVAACGILDGAKASDLTPEYMNCTGRATTNMDIDDCGKVEVARQETRLKRAWDAAQACFQDSDQTAQDAKESLVEEERLWIKWKDASCKFYFPSRPGDVSQGFRGREGEVLEAPSCMAEIISQRATFLERLARSCGPQ